jgi:hypothetical protein
VKRILALVVLAIIADALLFVPAQRAGKPSNAPQYTKDGKLLMPANYRDWNFLSSGLGMTYAKSGPDNHPMFTNVYATPESYHAFLQTGQWPDKTILMLEEYSSATEGSINEGGKYQVARVGLEAHVKDSSRPGHLWKFYGFDEKGAPADARGEGNPCTKCHVKNGGVEDTFVQFYPTLLPIARAKGTLRPGTDVAPKN